MSVERTLWIHGETDKALLLGPRTSPARGDAWFPLSQLEILERGYIRNPHFGALGACEFLGPRVRVRGPEWLFTRTNFPEESDHENCPIER